MMTGIPIAQTKSEVLIATAHHFVFDATSLHCLLGERGTVSGTVVASDPENDLALIIGKLDATKFPWQPVSMSASDANSGTVVTLGYPKNGALAISEARVTGGGWCDRRFVDGESGGAVFQNGRLVGVISARTPSPQDIRRDVQFQKTVQQQPDFQKAMAGRTGPLADMVVGYYNDLESRRMLGNFVPVSKLRSFVAEAAGKLALSHPVFTTFYKEKNNANSTVGN
jgi:hypothetical protein